MERLTYKNYLEEYEVNFEKNSKNQWSIAESDTHIRICGEPIDKLAEFEDFMEEQGFESLKELKIKLGKSFYVYDDDARQGKVFNGVFFSYEQLMVMDAWNEFNNDYFKKYLDKQRENQALKDRWEKLKDYLNNGFDGYPDLGGAWVIKVDDVLDKMEELEKGGK